MPEGGSSSDQAEVTSESTVGVGAKRKERPAEELTPVPEEMSLPVAAIMRIIKAKLPDGVQIGKEAKTAFSKACSIFIMYVTTIANDLAKESKRSTVTAADVLHALKELEFDDFLPMVENSLFAYRENDKAKALEAAAKRAARTGDEGASAFDAGDAKDDDGAGVTEDQFEVLPPSDFVVSQKPLSRFEHRLMLEARAAAKAVEPRTGAAL